MQSLYSKGFEHLYDAMYQTFINYEEEYKFYSVIVRKYQQKKLLEIGCGTGNLAKHFITPEFDYVGLDLSQDMIVLCQSKNPDGTFIQGDVTNFELDFKVDLALITGRTTSYLVSNTDVNNALKSISKNLNSSGILCFDFIDATRFFKEIKGGKKVRHSAIFDEKKYYRESYMNIAIANNFMFHWDANYYEKSGSKDILLTKDSSTVRAFTKEEWELLLYLNGFELLEMIDRKSYAFDTYVVVARKMR